MPLTTHVAALGSTNSERVTATAREGFVRTCACTEPDGTDIGAVHVERGGQTRPKNTLNHTEKLSQGTLPSYAFLYEESFFFSLGKPSKKRLALRARAPHYDTKHLLCCRAVLEHSRYSSSTHFRRS